MCYQNVLSSVLSKWHIKIYHQNFLSKCLNKRHIKIFHQNILSKYVIKMAHQNVSSKCLIKMFQQNVSSKFHSRQKGTIIQACSCYLYNQFVIYVEYSSKNIVHTYIDEINSKCWADWSGQQKEYVTSMCNHLW